MARNCWRNCTAMETGLGLALIVSITFLIMMIIIYICMTPAGERILAALVGTRYYKCSEACDCIYDYTKTLTTNTYFIKNESIPRSMEMDTDLLGQESRAELQTLCHSENYPIAAVLKQTYIDELNTFDFLCPAAILSSLWLLSNQNLKGTTSDIFVAVGSKYWSKNGYLHNVEKIVPISDVVLLKLENELLIKVNFFDFLGSTQTFTVSTWNSKHRNGRTVKRDLEVVEDKFCTKETFCAILMASGIDMTSTFAISSNHLYGFYKDSSCNKGHCVYKFNSIKPYVPYINMYLSGNTL